jgi:hypothetical protein
LTGRLYVRLRITTDTLTDDPNTDVDERSLGPASDGEVEDYAIPLPALAVTLSWFLAEQDGGAVHFRWQTATETGTAGFNILAITDGGPVQMNTELVESKAIDSVEPLDYAFTATTTATSFLLQEVEITGAQNNHGPFEIGVEYGSYTDSNPIDLEDDGWTIFLPFVTGR